MSDPDKQLGADVDRTPGAPIVMALSGGGFRATLFHLGGLRALQEVGRLGDIRHVVGVSGGAILAADLQCRFHDYEDSFDSASKKLLALIRRGPRGRMFRRWMFRIPFLWPFWVFRRIWLRFRRRLSVSVRSALMLREYRWLFGDGRLSDLARNSPVKVHLLSTDLSSGSLCIFHEDKVTRWAREAPLAGTDVLNAALAHTKMEFRPKGIGESAGSRPRAGTPTRWRLHEQYGCTKPVSFPLLASSSFPVVFPSLPVVLKQVVSEGLDLGQPQEFVLADGGIIDNSGFSYASRLVADMAGSADKPIVIISDASSAFEHIAARDFDSMVPLSAAVSSVSRIVDVAAYMRRDTFLMEHFWDEDACTVISARITAYDDDVCRMTKEGVGNIVRCRTDLDRFSRNECAAIQQHGYDVMRVALEKAGFGAPDRTEPWVHPRMADDARRARVERSLAKSSRLRLRLLAWDVPTVTNIVILLSLVLLVFRAFQRSADNADMDLVAAKYQQDAFEQTKTRRILCKIEIRADKEQQSADLTGELSVVADPQTFVGFGKLRHGDIPQFAAFATRVEKGVAEERWPSWASTPPGGLTVDVAISATRTPRGVRSVALRCAKLEPKDNGWEGDLYYWSRGSLFDRMVGSCRWMSDTLTPSPKSDWAAFYGAAVEWTSILQWGWVKRGYITIKPIS